MVNYCVVERCNNVEGRDTSKQQDFVLFQLYQKNRSGELIRTAGLTEENPKLRSWNVIEYVVTTSGWPTMKMESSVFLPQQRWDRSRRELIRTQPGSFVCNPESSCTLEQTETPRQNDIVEAHNAAQCIATKLWWHGHSVTRLFTPSINSMFSYEHTEDKRESVCKTKGAFTYDVSKILANFTPLPPVSSCQHWATPLWWRQHLPDPPPFQSHISFSKNPLHSTLIETLNVYLIQLKTERCHQFRGVY